MITKPVSWMGAAVDLGASSGRVILGGFQNGAITFEECHRFSNDPVRIHNTLHWDILRLWHEVQTGLGKASAGARNQGANLHTIGVDSWGVDFGLLGRTGMLAQNPVHYRDRRTLGVMDSVLKNIPREEIFDITGIQFLPFNTIYQLAALRRQNPRLLDESSQLLMIPDLIHYFLTGERRMEFTNATTTQLMDIRRGCWARELMDKLSIPGHLFEEPTQPGTKIGEPLPHLASELFRGVSPAIVAVGTHDTASAVVAVPARSRKFAYLSCGTWSLLGTETPEPILGPAPLLYNFTNEGGAGGMFRYLKNIMGLWLIQETRSEWARKGRILSWDEMTSLSLAGPPLAAFIDPDCEDFLAQGDMTPRITAFCLATGQNPPSSEAAMLRCITESLAMKVRHLLSPLERSAGFKCDVLHIIGGGAQNAALCQWIANACGIETVAGPVEATALGNFTVQLLASGQLNSIAQGREAIARSFPPRVYEPKDTEKWNEAYEQFHRILKKKTL